MLGCTAFTAVAGSRPGTTSACCQGRDPIPPPDDRIFLGVFEAGDLAQRYDVSVAQGDLQRTDRFQRRPLPVFCAHVNVDQVYAVAHLGDRAAGYNTIESQRHVLGAEPQLARLVLVDPYAHDARRLGPVEVDEWAKARAKNPKVVMRVTVQDETDEGG